MKCFLQQTNFPQCFYSFNGGLVQYQALTIPLNHYLQFPKQSSIAQRLAIMSKLINISPPKTTKSFDIETLPFLPYRKTNIHKKGVQFDLVSIGYFTAKLIGKVSGLSIMITMSKSGIPIKIFTY